MDLTLQQYISKSDDIHCKLEGVDNLIQFLEMKKYISELESMVKQLQTVSIKIANIHNICKNKYKQRLLVFKKKINTLDIDVAPGAKDWTYINRNINKKSITHSITPDININIKKVKSLDEIPNTPIYWVSDINQFAIQLNGVIFRGNIGNIYNKRNIQTNSNINQTIICMHGNACQKLLHNEPCKFYHDPVELQHVLVEKKISKETYLSYCNKHRNFVNTSWMYSNIQCNQKNKSMRHFGSRNMLKHEFNLMQINNSRSTDIDISNFRQQCMHDILVIFGLNQCGLLKDYPDINMQPHFYDESNMFTHLPNHTS
jgi:hypothetical protein